jgi:leader peptidase (prepilin peptidase)/N-methyltransferase
MTDLHLLTFVGVLGLAVGSFLNVCIYRLPLGQSVVSPPSRCTSCGRRLRWYDNVPIVSYAILRGRCRGCGASVSPMYPLVEGVTAVVFVLQAWMVGAEPLLIQRLIFSSAMIVLFTIDLQHRILPNVITVPGIVVGFLFSLVGPPGWVDALIGIAVGGGSLLAIAEAYYRWRGEEGLGMGDVKMLAMIGAFLGWRLTLVTLVLSSVAGSIIGVGVIAASRGNLKYALPFGTFLALGALASAAVGEPLLAWYLSFY